MKEDRKSKKLTLGILAHVDAGKTTLSEEMLYASGAIRKKGRVDHGDAFLDNDSLERKRGITIFSKQARFQIGDLDVTLLDTPGHVDFSAEMERTLSVLDMAVLVISAQGGIESHTETLLRLLARNEVPAFIFVNKMDIAVRKKEEILTELRKAIGAAVCDLSPSRSRDDLADDLTLLSEDLAEKVLSGLPVTDEDISRLVRERALFPCYFGSALKGDGVEELLDGILRFGPRLIPLPAFGARVYKIGHGKNGERLSFLKITGGVIRVKEELPGAAGGPAEKIDQIRLYSGERFSLAEEAGAGDIVAVTGPSALKAGDSLGIEPAGKEEILEPYLRYSILQKDGGSITELLAELRALAEEDPKLGIEWDRNSGEIRVSLMGEVQMEVLESRMKSLYGREIAFTEGRVIYRETIGKKAEGVGHFEPLRHYAEVHLLLEPGERGSGITLDTSVSEDELDRNWQRLILTHLTEKEFRGVLTGAPVTDIKITLAAGRAHKKHTEGGDFREATYRAVRNGLMKADSILLEPWLRFRAVLPSEQAGRLMTDIRMMGGETGVPLPSEDPSATVLEGRAPASGMGSYQRDFLSYTKGKGKLMTSLDGYDICHDPEKVIAESGYDPLRDPDDPPGSVFTSHGSSFLVPWDEVEEHMHIPSVLKEQKNTASEDRAARFREKLYSDEDLMAIFERTYGPVRKDPPGRRNRKPAPPRREIPRAGEVRKSLLNAADDKPEVLLVDGYNVIHAWPELASLAEASYEMAREKLKDILCNYQGYSGQELILVFDAYRRSPNPGSREAFHNITVVYTKEDETADMYIEKEVRSLKGKRRVLVVTSDALEQLIVMGHGALRISAREFLMLVRDAESEIRDLLY